MSDTLTNSEPTFQAPMLPVDPAGLDEGTHHERLRQKQRRVDLLSHWL
ncbi:MAG: hypothetical protein ABI720_01430 [Actinomycetes bacterium]